MQRRFLTNLALVLVLNLLVKPFYILGIDAGVQDAVGTATYGGYAALLSLSFLLNILLDAGITNFSARHIARHTQLMRKHLSGVLAARMLLVVLYGVVTFAAAWVLGYRGGQLTLLAWLVLNQALVATILYLRGHIAGAQRYRQDSLLSVLDRLMLIFIVGGLLWGRTTGTPFRIEWFVWAQTAAYAFTLLTALVLVLRIAGPVRPVWRPVFIWSIVRQSLPYALLVLLMTFYYRTDSVMLERMLPDGAFHAGVYAQGFRFFEALNMLGYLFAGLLLPMFSRMLKEGSDVGPLAGLAFRLMLGGALVVAVVAGLEAKAVMDLRYTEATDLSAPAFAVLMGCFVAVGTTYIFGTLLTAAGDLRLLNTMAAGGMVLNIVLNLVLIPRYQALGAAWASLITQGLTALVQLVFAAGRHKVALPWGLWTRALLLVGATGGLVVLLGLAGFGAPVRLAAGLAGGLVFAIGSGLVPPKGIASVLRGGEAR